MAGTQGFATLEETGQYRLAVLRSLTQLQEETIDEQAVLRLAVRVARIAPGSLRPKQNHEDDSAVAQLRRLALEWKEPILDIEPLWHPQANQVGYARFPVVLKDGATHVGALRAIRVGPGLQPVHPVDARFRHAVEVARSAVHRRCPDILQKALDSLGRHEHGWTIEPDLVQGGQLHHGSVALAAYVAHISFLLGRPLAMEVVLTGEFEAGRFGTPGGLEEKRKAVVAAGLPDDALIIAVGWLGDDENMTARLASWFGVTKDFLKIFFAEDSPVSRARREREMTATALLAAVPFPLSRHVAGDALAELLKGNLEGTSIDAVLRDLVRYGEAISPNEDRWQAHPEADVDSERVRRAAKVLAQLATDSSDEKLKLAAPGLAGLASPGKWKGPGICSNAEDFRSAVLSLRIVARNSDALAAAEPRDATTPEGVLLSALWACLRAPWAFRGLAERLERCETWLDRALWLQAVAECALHCTAAVALAGITTRERDQLNSDEREFLARPAIGRLGTAIQLAAKKASGSLATYFGAWGNDPASIAQPFNKLLHHPGAWQELQTPAIEGKAREQIVAVGAVIAALRDWARVARSAELIGSGEELSLRFPDQQEVGLSGLVRADANTGVLAHYRGVIGRQFRWWSWGTGEVLHADARSEQVDPRELIPASRVAVSRALRPLLAEKPEGLPDFLQAAFGRCRRASEATLARIAALDLVTAATLRLALFASSTPPADLTQELPSKHWLRLAMNKRNLRDAFSRTESGVAADAPLRAVLRELDAELLPVIDWLEWWEHAAPPLAPESALLDALSGRLSVVLHRLFIGEKLQLGNGPPTLSLRGDSPMDASAFVRFEGSTLWLLAQAQGSKKTVGKLKPELISWDRTGAVLTRPARWEGADGRLRLELRDLSRQSDVGEVSSQ